MNKAYEELRTDFEDIIYEIQEANKRGDWYKSVCITKFLSNALYELNYTYRADSLETSVLEIGSRLLDSLIINEPSDKKVLFYDGFGMFNRGLATIYINALIELGYKVVWIMNGTLPEIHEILDVYGGKVSFRFLPVRYINIMDRITILAEYIIEEHPSRMFFYTYPNDVEGAICFSAVKGDVCRYLINLTDHAYWLGRDSVDKVIEFRNLGANISVVERGVMRDSIEILPYYPEKRKQYKYEGMPFSDSEEFFFSGGSVYKTKGSEIFFDIVKSVLRKYNRLNFVYAGHGADKDSSFISLVNEFPERVYLIEERRDLDAVMQHAKFYLGTYPIGGGLMTQYSLMNDCIPVCLYDNEFTNPKSWLLHPENVDFCFKNTEELLDYVDVIMNGYTKNNLKEHVITKEAFLHELDLILSNNSIRKYEAMPVDISSFREIYKKEYSYEKYLKMVNRSRNPYIIEKYINDLKNYHLI